MVDVPVPAYRPIDRTLTVPIAEPAAPAAHCSWLGTPAVCVLDALAWIEQWRGKLQEANTDRATAAKVSAGPQP